MVMRKGVNLARQNCKSNVEKCGRSVITIWLYIDAKHEKKKKEEKKESWAEKKLAAAFFMDVKGAFDHVLQTRLLKE